MSDEDIQLTEDQVSSFFSTGGELPETTPETPAAETPAQTVPKTPETPAEPTESQPEWAKNAITEERNRRREAEDRARRLEETFSQVMQRLPNAEQGGPIEEEYVTPEEQVAKVQARLNQLEAERNQQAQVQALRNHVNGLEVEFAKTTPDYPDAANFATKARIQEYEMLGYNPAQAHTLVQQEYFVLVNNALQQGKNPAELIYNFAKHRGFNNKPAAPQGGQTPSPFGKVPQNPPSSLAQTPSDPATGDVTLEMLSSMSSEEFDVIWKKMEKESRV